MVIVSVPTSYHTNGPNGEVTRVVIHGTVSPCVKGGARANARYFQSPSAGGAAHYVVDPGEIVSCIDEALSAAHAPPNHGSIGVELCDPQTGDGARWQDADHQSMLHLAAELVADICVRHRLPLVWLSPADLVAGKRGITSHANVSAAFHQTDHTDPGPDFPVDEFLALLQPSEVDVPQPASCWTGSTFHVFDVVDKVIFHAFHDGQWQGPERIDSACLSGPSCSAQGDRIDLSVVGVDGLMYHCFRADAKSPWEPWEPLPGKWA